MDTGLQESLFGMISPGTSHIFHIDFSCSNSEMLEQVAHILSGIKSNTRY
jgi:hypothetical protein